MNDLAIDIEGLCVQASRKTLLAIERLCVARGELLGLLGPNGAGKTTLLRSCLGLQRTTAGTIAVLGQRVRELGSLQTARLRQRIGYVPQLLAVRSEIPLTVREVVAMGRAGAVGVFRRLSAQDWQIVDDWIERLGLAPLAKQGYGEISGGEQRKTLIARAMVQQPEMLLLDEPTANLDLGWRERIVRIVDDLYRTTRIAVVLICHELEVLPPSCRRVAVLRAGRLVADGAPADVLTDGLLESMYGPGLTTIRKNGRYAVIPGVSAHA